MSLVIGVDVAKSNSMYAFFDTNSSTILKPFKVNNDVIGLLSILSKIEKVYKYDFNVVFLSWSLLATFRIDFVTSSYLTS